ncbi:MAG: hypothetical protein M3Z92_14505 [Bacteroidota bacterium]|nr:hypothetical protein [Bacteroidota bacterium]MDQ6890470.1 hypothetical protein [Bacteroidota bacterium]
MKNKHWLPVLCIILLPGCKKEILPVPDKEMILTTTVSSNYIQYTIPEGKQYCDENVYMPVVYSELKFKVKFDSSAIYTTREPRNQYDINKLYGFSDNNSNHHKFSARFGWRWNDDSLRLFGYVYNDGTMRFKEIGTVSINAENFCSIKIGDGFYTFTLNDKADTLIRKSTTLNAVGYRLYPYFGGDEFAPHDIRIWIQEIP